MFTTNFLSESILKFSKTVQNAVADINSSFDSAAHLTAYPQRFHEEQFLTTPQQNTPTALPWLILPADTSKLALEKILKITSDLDYSEILKVSNETTHAPADFNLNLANLMLATDTNLQAARYSLVPNQMTDCLFWMSYLKLVNGIIKEFQIENREVGCAVVDDFGGGDADVEGAGSDWERELEKELGELEDIGNH